jgi:hypothetical protein
VREKYPPRYGKNTLVLNRIFNPHLIESQHQFPIMTASKKSLWKFPASLLAVIIGIVMVLTIIARMMDPS